MKQRLPLSGRRQITDDTFAHLQGWLRPGLTELEVAAEIQRFMLAQGAEGLAFPSIMLPGQMPPCRMQCQASASWDRVSR